MTRASGSAGFAYAADQSRCWLLTTAAGNPSTAAAAAMAITFLV